MIHMRNNIPGLIENLKKVECVKWIRVFRRNQKERGSWFG